MFTFISLKAALSKIFIQLSLLALIMTTIYSSNCLSSFFVLSDLHETTLLIFYNKSIYINFILRNLHWFSKKICTPFFKQSSSSRIKLLIAISYLPLRLHHTLSATVSAFFPRSFFFTLILCERATELSQLLPLNYAMEWIFLNTRLFPFFSSLNIS